MARYRQPRKLNWVSIPIYAAVLALLYGAVRFGPAYYRNMQVDEVVRSAVNEYWSAMRGTTATEPPDELRRSVEERIRAIGIDDPEMEVFFDRDANNLTVTVAYQVVIKHPLIGKPTILHFNPTASTPIVDKRL